MAVHVQHQVVAVASSALIHKRHASRNTQHAVWPGTSWRERPPLFMDADESTNIFSLPHSLFNFPEQTRTETKASLAPKFAGHTQHPVD
jgi:hypothetical protein